MWEFYVTNRTADTVLQAIDPRIALMLQRCSWYLPQLRKADYLSTWCSVDN
jgi:hypothetical protein